MLTAGFAEMPLFIEGICLEEEGYDMILDGRSGGAYLNPVLSELT